MKRRTEAAVTFQAFCRSQGITSPEEIADFTDHLAGDTSERSSAEWEAEFNQWLTEKGIGFVTAVRIERSQRQYLEQEAQLTAEQYRVWLTAQGVSEEQITAFLADVSPDAAWTEAEWEAAWNDFLQESKRTNRRTKEQMTVSTGPPKFEIGQTVTATDPLLGTVYSGPIVLIDTADAALLIEDPVHAQVWVKLAWLNASKRTKGTLASKRTQEKKEHSAAWHRCVDEVKAQGGGYNPYAVCTWSLSRAGGEDVYEEVVKEVVVTMTLPDAEEADPILAQQMRDKGVSALTIDTDTWEVTEIMGESTRSRHQKEQDPNLLSIEEFAQVLSPPLDATEVESLKDWLLANGVDPRIKQGYDQWMKDTSQWAGVDTLDMGESKRTREAMDLQAYVNQRPNDDEALYNFYAWADKEYADRATVFELAEWDRIYDEFQKTHPATGRPTIVESYELDRDLTVEDAAAAWGLDDADTADFMQWAADQGLLKQYRQSEWYGIIERWEEERSVPSLQSRRTDRSRKAHPVTRQPATVEGVAGVTVRDWFNKQTVVDPDFFDYLVANGVLDKFNIDSVYKSESDWDVLWNDYQSDSGYVPGGEFWASRDSRHRTREQVDPDASMQFEYVRRDGQCNMTDKDCIQRVANDLGFHALAAEEDYSSFIQPDETAYQDWLSELGLQAALRQALKAHWPSLNKELNGPLTQTSAGGSIILQNRAGERFTASLQGGQLTIEDVTASGEYDGVLKDGTVVGTVIADNAAQARRALQSTLRSQRAALYKWQDDGRRVRPHDTKTAKSFERLGVNHEAATLGRSWTPGPIRQEIDELFQENDG